MATREHINEYYNGRAFMVLCAVLLVVTAFVARALGMPSPGVEGHGLFFSLSESLIADGMVSTGVNVLCLLLSGSILLAVNKVFTFVRSTTHLTASAFYLLALANPAGLVSFNVGTMMCLLTALTLPPLFGAFQDRHCQRSIFLIFALVATGCLFHYGFLVLIPAILLGFLNMGVLNLKGLLAMLFGLVTPLWLVLGLGIASPRDAVPPQWQFLEHLSISPLMGLAAATALLGLVLAVMNLRTIMNYRKQPRVYNIFFITLLVLIVITLLPHYRDLLVYLPLLNLAVAVQIAQTHTLRTIPHRYLLLLLLVAGCVASSAYILMNP